MCHGYDPRPDTFRRYREANFNGTAFEFETRLYPQPCWHALDRYRLAFPSGLTQSTEHRRLWASLPVAGGSHLFTMRLICLSVCDVTSLGNLEPVSARRWRKWRALLRKCLLTVCGLVTPLMAAYFGHAAWVWALVPGRPPGLSSCSGAVARLVKLGGGASCLVERRAWQTF